MACARCARSATSRARASTRTKAALAATESTWAGTYGSPPVISAMSRYWCSTNSREGETPSRCATPSRIHTSHSRAASAVVRSG